VKARETLEKEFAPLRDLVKALTGGKTPTGKTEIDVIREQLDAQAKTIADQSVSLLRADVTRDKKLTAEQAAELRGATYEELAAHADKLLALFGKPADPADPGRRTAPRADPAQGARPGGKVSGAEAGRAEAQKRFGKPPTT